jgi:DnaJ-class molecular chaperone
MIKKIDDWNFYELLNVERTASREEIREAYMAAVETYKPGSLASYSLVDGAEREQILARIEDAYRTLSDPVRKKNYDLALLSHTLDHSPKAPFRQSFQKLEIEEAETKKSFWDRILGLFRKN